MKKKKVLVIVAHPDDETIWMGGYLFRNKDKWDTTIISLCRKDDTDRAPKFHKVCNYLKAKCFISDLDDEKLNRLDLNEIKKRIKDFLKDDITFDYIFTHGENGEYGHIRHMEANKAVKEMLDDKTLKADRIFFFSYIKTPNEKTETGFDTYASPTANKFINLDNLEFLTKGYLIHNIYGFQIGGFEERNCRKVESFDVKKLKNKKEIIKK